MDEVFFSPLDALTESQRQRRQEKWVYLSCDPVKDPSGYGHGCRLIHEASLADEAFERHRRHGGRKQVWPERCRVTRLRPSLFR